MRFVKLFSFLIIFLFLGNYILSFDEKELALKYSPLIFIDEREPFLPYKIGYTVFRENAKSDSFNRLIHLENGEICIEYAVFWDFDIEHMYDLEHVWVYIKSDEIIKVEGSWHGKYRIFKEFQLIDGHPVVYAQPGKHGFASTKEHFNGDLFNYLRTIIPCKFLAGRSGILQKGYKVDLERGDEELVKSYLKKYAFLPSFSFTKIFEVGEENLVSWEELKIEIPERISYLLTNIRENFNFPLTCSYSNLIIH